MHIIKWGLRINRTSSDGRKGELLSVNRSDCVCGRQFLALRISAPVPIGCDVGTVFVLVLGKAGFERV